MIRKSAPNHTHRIWVAGDYDDAIRACRAFTMRGLCVSVQPVDYVYTQGMESGVCVTLINYPRFPQPPAQIKATAEELAAFLCDELCQGSYTIETPDEMIWVSHRTQDEVKA